MWSGSSACAPGSCVNSGFRLQLAYFCARLSFTTRAAVSRFAISPSPGMRKSWPWKRSFRSDRGGSIQAADLVLRLNRGETYFPESLRTDVESGAHAFPSASRSRASRSSFSSFIATGRWASLLSPS